MRLRASAPAKVNLCLFLGGLRDDGRHELVTLFESVSLADELSLEVVSEAPDQVICAGVEGPNLVASALSALRAGGWSAPPVRVEIAKRIPVAAGMGGGSADAAAVLRLAEAVAPLADGLAGSVARALGADVPSQLVPGLALGLGAGDLVERVGALAPHALLILPQPFALSTADVYREADRLGLPRSAQDLAEKATALSQLGDRLPEELFVNDLEPATVSLCPVVVEALDAARYTGAEQAMVCGSGPTVAGIFWGGDAGARARVGAAALAGQYPGAVAVSPVDAGFGDPAPPGIHGLGHNS